VIGVGGTVVIALALGPFHERVGRATPSLLLIVPVVAAGFVGGMAAAFITALAAGLLLLVVFIPPVGTLTVDVPADAVALTLFVVVALAIGRLVSWEAGRRRGAVERAEELARMHRQLQTAVRERDRLETEARRVSVLEEMDRQRSALLRAVSHDLRTPLGTIKAITSDLRSGTEFDDVTRRTLLDLVWDEAERLDRIVANLLSLSRVEAGALDPDRRPIDALALVDHCVDRLQRVLRSSPVKIEAEAELPLMWADFTQIDQVLSNLLENAARHAPTGTPIVIGVSASDRFVGMTVEDQGPGVAPALRSHLFEPFQGGDGSTGIGLAICKAIVEAHNGRIRLDTSPEGARFVFDIPTAR